MGYDAVVVIHIYLATGFVFLAVAVVNPLVETTVIGRVRTMRAAVEIKRGPRAACAVL